MELYDKKFVEQRTVKFSIWGLKTSFGLIVPKRTKKP